MANTNCLVGMRCPKCKEDGPFYIEVIMFVLMHDDGDDSHDGDQDWGAESQCSCWHCKHAARVVDFRMESQDA
jgi:hypothetical protein